MNLDTILPLVNRPSRYCGFEFNTVRKDWNRVDLHIALAFPDLYEIGMSHQGLQILYHILNRRDTVLAERVYAPDLDLEGILRSRHESLFSLESRRPLADFDIIGITLPYELCYTNILTILDLSGLPLRAKDRDDRHPLVIGGGPCAFHPEPVADFFDAILLGDGEDAVLEIVDTVMAAKKERLDKAALLDLLSGIEGVYVPAYFSPAYDQQGHFREITPLKAGYEKVRRRIMPELPGNELPPPLVPVNKIVHDRLGIEIARGCTRGCRFCQAGFIYRPVRERSPEQVLALAREGIARAGFDELALLSLSTGDYSCLSDLLIALMDEFATSRVSVSMPSMRIGTLTPDIMEQIKRVRKTGFTVAPEAGSERLRQVINKGITEQDLLDTCDQAFDLGWKLIKFYFMFGLPTETWEDLEAIPELARKALRMCGGRNCQINVSAATYVPKPHTPFQWEPQIGIEEGRERIAFLKSSLRGRGLKLKWHDPRQSFLEGVLSRGDRRLAGVIEDAWRFGARLDAWTDYLDFAVWRRSAEKHSIDLDHYLDGRPIGAPLPWQHLDVGVDGKFLVEELEKSRKGIYTPDCRNQGCQKCGLCDFKTIKPVVWQQHEKIPLQEEMGPETEEAGDARLPAPGVMRQESLEVKDQAAGPHYTYRFTYSKLGEARFISHLEMIQMFCRALSRMRLPVLFSLGFNPTPRISFSPALPVGTESMAEFFQVDVSENIDDPASLILLMNRHLPDGVRIKSIELATKKAAEITEICYHVFLSKTPDPLVFEEFLAAKEYFLSIARKGKEKQINARSLVSALTLLDTGSIELVMLSKTGQAGIKPLELLSVLLRLSDEDARLARVVKEWSRELG